VLASYENKGRPAMSASGWPGKQVEMQLQIEKAPGVGLD
jgi:hypothetical protein